MSHTAIPRCSTCCIPLPCRLPPRLRAPRCAACQIGAWNARKENMGTAIELTEEQEAIVRKRIAAYQRRAECNEPLFAEVR